MLDETAYRETYADVNPLKCVFERGILRHCLACEHSIRRNIAEREAAGCENKEAHVLCSAFKLQLRHAAAFALKLTHPDDPIPHAKELKLQCGGLIGLERVLTHPEAEMVPNVAGSLAEATQKYQSLDQLPFTDLIQAIRAFEARPHR
jgi:hypothetical protein